MKKEKIEMMIRNGYTKINSTHWMIHLPVRNEIKPSSFQRNRLSSAAEREGVQKPC
jgi:hypothetical protein